MNAELKRERDRWGLAAGLTALFSVLYECFSHEVYSNSMLFAFAWPLLGGLLPFSLLLAAPEKNRPGPLSRSVYGSGIAAFTVGSLFRGILEIYGSTNRLSVVYFVGGCVLVSLGLCLWEAELRRRSKRREREHSLG